MLIPYNLNYSHYGAYSFSTYKVIKTLFDVLNYSYYSMDSTKLEKFPVLLSTHLKINYDVLPPLYSIFSPLLKNNKVGNPLISYFEAKPF